MKYIKLCDRVNKDEVIKEVDGKYYRYYYGPNEWVRSAIMDRYRWLDDEKFGEYVEISEEEAKTLMAQKRTLLEKLLLKAEKVAKEAHAGQMDKGGKPYFNHPKAVADSLDNTEQKIIAFLHDVCEDTPITFDELLEMGFTYRIVNDIRVLTKPKGMSYDEYLRGIKGNTNARQVKLADLEHNMDISRIPNPTERDLQRIEKYGSAVKFLLK